jgi:hypothetical protein
MSPSAKYWWRFLVGQWLGFCWFWDQRTSDLWLARQKLGKKMHPNHGGHRRPTAAMVHPPRHRDKLQAAHTLHDKSMSLKLEYLFFITSYLLFKGTAHCRCAVPVFAGCVGCWRQILARKKYWRPILVPLGVDSAWQNWCA